MGLCAASTDLKDAWDDVAIQLNHLAKGNHGMENSNFEPASSFQEFLKEVLDSVQEELAKDAAPKPSAMVPPSIAAWKMGQMADTLRDMEWIVSLIDAAAPKPGGLRKSI